MKLFRLLLYPPRRFSFIRPCFFLPTSQLLRFPVPARRRFVPARSMATAAMQKKVVLPRIPLFEAISKQPLDKIAVVHSASGKRFTYGSLLSDIDTTRARIAAVNNSSNSSSERGYDLKETRVALLVENGYEYVVSLLSIFASGGIAVPLCTSHPANEMRYVLEDSTPSILIATSKFRSKAEEILDNDASRMLRLEDFPPSAIAPVKVEVELLGNDWKDTNRGALTIYTSGTTNLPKGVVATHKSLGAQSSSLIAAWKMSQEDHLLHVLPLHHVHGILNATLMPLMAGSTIEFLFPFSPSSVWTRLVNGVARAHDPKKREMITVFTAVPTVYNRLILSLPQQPLEVQQAAQSAIKHLRLAMSGSAALPGSIRDNWRVLAGTAEGGGTILERYGMTEVGMALSNRLSISQRIENGVGWPLPGVEARLVDIETGQEIMTPQKEGEIQLRGDTVFREYWNKPDATAMEFVKDGGWFKTGDVATRDADGCYFIQGRRSVDIIKSGGEKISALEVERELLKLPQVVETTVVGIPDDDWGQRVAAIVVINEQAKKEKWGLDAMRLEMKKSLASYKVPTVLRMVDEIPRNQMGKINKKELAKKVFS